jgi:prepilin-type N-terminal cleavage/methylation domain-containing protein
MLHASTLRRGFTIIELLVVVSIISVLAAIVLVAGNSVLASGKRNATQDVLRVLDTALEAYITSKDGLPPALVNVWITDAAANARDENAKRLVPLGDVRVGTQVAPADTSLDPTLHVVNSAGLFVQVASTVPNAKGHIDSVPQKFMAPRPMLGTGSTSTQILTPLDSWNRPIRFVMPSFDGVIGATPISAAGAAVNLDSANFPPKPNRTDIYAFASVRRNNYYTGSAPPFGDSDGGRAVGRRPYFYSAGPDGNPATIEDNIYFTQPTFVKN